MPTIHMLQCSGMPFDLLCLCLNIYHIVENGPKIFLHGVTEKLTLEQYFHNRFVDKIFQFKKKNVTRFFFPPRPFCATI